MTQVREIMSTALFSCQLSDSLADAARLMREHACGCVPVVNRPGRVVGIVTDRDVRLCAYIQRSPLDDIPVQVCSQNVPVCTPEASLEHARDLLLAEQVRSFPVTGADGRLIGVLSWSALVRHMHSTSVTANRRVSARDSSSLVAKVVSLARAALGGKGVAKRMRVLRHRSVPRPVEPTAP